MTTEPRPLHTPGPWEIAFQQGNLEDESTVGIVGPEQTTKAGKKFTLYVCQYVKPEDAALIARAPELLARVEELEKRHDAYVETYEQMLKDRDAENARLQSELIAANKQIVVLARGAEENVRLREQTSNLSLLVVRLARRVRVFEKGSDVAAKALDYLSRNGLMPSVLRGNENE